jgi:acetyltransferase EpsM
MRTPFIIYGAGGHAKVAIDAARLAGLSPTLVLDDSGKLTTFLDLPIQPGSSLNQIKPPFNYFIAIGNNQIRAKLFAHLQSLGGTPTTIIHPNTTISPLAQIGPGTIIAAGAIINPGAKIGANCVINTAASVDHDCVLHDHVFIAPGVRLAGTVTVEESANIFTGAIVIPNLRIGANATVGAGAVVLRDVRPNTKVLGNPARAIP